MIYDRLPTVTGQPYWTVPYEEGGVLRVDGQDLREIRPALRLQAACALENIELLHKLEEIRQRGTAALAGTTPEEHALEIATLNDEMLEVQPIFAMVHKAYALSGDISSPTIARIAKLKGFRHEPDRLRSWDKVSQVIEGRNGRLFRRTDGVTVLGRVATKLT